VLKQPIGYKNTMATESESHQSNNPKKRQQSRLKTRHQSHLVQSIQNPPMQIEDMNLDDGDIDE
jgi:hypothetical protein